MLDELRVAVGLAWLAQVMCGQVPPPRELGDFVPAKDLEARWAAGKEFSDLVWRVDDAGSVYIWPDPSSGDPRSWLPLLGRYRQDSVDHRVRAIRNIGRQDLALLLVTSLRGPGQLLGIVDVQRHFERWHPGLEETRLRQFAVLPVEASTPALRRRALLEQQVAILLLQQRRSERALAELRFLAEHADDRMLRWTAGNAWHDLDPEHAPPARVALPIDRLEPPPSADLWIYVDFGRWRARPDLAGLGRAHSLQEIHRQLRTGSPGPYDPFWLAGAQLHADRPGELAFEMARCWGRARVDQALLAFGPRDSTAGSRWFAPRGSAAAGLQWLAASGAFEPAVLAAHLAALGVPTQTDGKRIIARNWWPHYAIELEQDLLIVRHASVPTGAAGSCPKLARGAQKVIAALALELAPQSPLAPLHALLLPAGGKLMLTLAPFRAELTSAASAAGVRGSLRGAATTFRLADSMLLPSDIRSAWLQLLSNAEPELLPQSGCRLLLTSDELDPLDLLPLLLLLD